MFSGPLTNHEVEELTPRQWKMFQPKQPLKRRSSRRGGQPTAAGIPAPQGRGRNITAYGAHEKCPPRDRRMDFPCKDRVEFPSRERPEGSEDNFYRPRLRASGYLKPRALASGPSRGLKASWRSPSSFSQMERFTVPKGRFVVALRTPNVEIKAFMNPYLERPCADL